MRVKRIVLITTTFLVGATALILVFPALSQLLIMSNSGVDEGIEFYAPAASSLGICEWLTLGEDESGRSRSDPYLFINKYRWESAYFCYEKNNSFSVQNETVLLSLGYSEDVFEQAQDYICSRPGFSTEVYFSYGNYQFALNETERLRPTNKALTDFSFSPPNEYIKWINLVGYSTVDFKLVFLGFYYGAYEQYFGSGTKGYPFQGWQGFIEEFFPFL